MDSTQPIVARAPSALSIQTYAASAHSAPPRHFGTRYNPQGQFLPEPGNTIVSHLVEGSASQAAVIAVRQQLLDMPDAGRYAFTPISSLHMTVFQGIIEKRRQLPYWPPQDALDTPIPEMTRRLIDRLGAFRSPGPFAVKVSAVTPHGLTMVPASADDAACLKAWRDRLAEIFQYRHPDHDTYEFHITFAYSIAWIPDDRLAAWEAVLLDCFDTLQQSAPVIDLAPPAFCSFDDMNHFEELLVLG